MRAHTAECINKLQLATASEKLVTKTALCLEGAIIEAEYADVVPPGFFSECIRFFLEGHFACGLEGDYRLFMWYLERSVPADDINQDAVNEHGHFLVY